MNGRKSVQGGWILLKQTTFTVEPGGRAMVDLTARVQSLVGGSGVARGLCHLFIHHTSASLMICENADPQVLRDMETFMSQLVPDGHAMFGHDDEGPDDMPAHVRSVLTCSSLTVPVAARRCDLGTWQGIFLWEHRHAPHARRVTVSVQGEPGA
jgi:secondary thiamine-phosphate synthase enzyme